MSLKNININVYNPGTEVYALSRYHENNVPNDHVAIYPAIVESSYIEVKKDGTISVDYQLLTPDNRFWGDFIISDDISTEFEALVLKMKELWYKNANMNN